MHKLTTTIGSCCLFPLIRFLNLGYLICRSNCNLHLTCINTQGVLIQNENNFILIFNSTSMGLCIPPRQDINNKNT